MNFNKDLERVETYFNIAGSIPIVAVISGSLRVTAGQVQLVVAGIFTLAAYLISKCGVNMDETVEKGYKHVKHGLGNIGRGLGEGILGATLLGPIFLGLAQAGKGASQGSWKQGFAPMFIHYSEA